MIHTLFLILAVILDSIECSSKSSREPHSERNLGSSSSSAGNQHSPDQPSHEETAARARSRSPDKWSPSMKVLGYSLEQLGYVRLISRKNESFQFEFRRCFFPEGIPIRLRAEQNRRGLVPTQEQIVLSLSNGDVFAILEYAGILRGIYATDTGYPRVKMNIISGAINRMTRDEMKVCPLGIKFSIFPKSFIEASSINDSLAYVWNAYMEPDETTPRARPSSPPGRPPSDRVLGHPLGQLGYIRLIPLENRNRRFEFRRYIIPTNEPIQLFLQYCYMPVPNREHIVLTTSDGDVFAILEYTGILRGIYREDRRHARVKINMISGIVDDMTAMEMKECHVGNRYPPIPRWFNQEASTEDSLQHVYQ